MSPARKSAPKKGAKKPATKKAQPKVAPLEASKPVATVKKRRENVTASKRKDIPPVVVNPDANGRNMGGRPPEWTVERLIEESEKMLAVLAAEDNGGRTKIILKEQMPLAVGGAYSWKSFQMACKYHEADVRISDNLARIGERLKIRWAIGAAARKLDPYFAKFILSADFDTRERVEVAASGKVETVFDDNQVKSIAQAILTAGKR